MFLKADGFFEDYTVQEDLSSLGMGYRIFIFTEEIIISLSISELENRADFRLSKRDRKVGVDWCTLKSEFDAKIFFDIDFQELSTDFDEIKEYVNGASAKLSDMLDELGVDGVIQKLN
ncbi:hypothetical protein ACFO4O_15225 [Glaciecola siphonariae]|uniref:Uncharacterized protein n=1 Tax=Glaciecola siphonariae TaxID=521012 RepID=A0ABV9M1I5_9ALTE